jgi:CRP/FNR family cyclic AMP-dependent transcriptional regulator
MSAPAAGHLEFHVAALMRAIAQNNAMDVFRPALNNQQWEMLGTYLQPLAAAPGQVLIQQGATDRTVYLIEDGSVTVHYEDRNGRIHIAGVDAGSAVGEGAFFSREPRNATVQAASHCKLWSLTPMRFSELSNRQPPIALEVAMALGALVSRRLAKRVAFT